MEGRGKKWGWLEQGKGAVWAGRRLRGRKVGGGGTGGSAGEGRAVRPVESGAVWWGRRRPRESARRGRSQWVHREKAGFLWANGWSDQTDNATAPLPEPISEQTESVVQITTPPTIRVPTKSAHFHSSADLGSTPPATLRLSLPSATLRSLPPARLRCPLSPPPPSPPLSPRPRGEVAPSLEPALTLQIPAFSHMAPRASSVLQ